MLQGSLVERQKVVVIANDWVGPLDATNAACLASGCRPGAVEQVAIVARRASATQNRSGRSRRGDPSIRAGARRRSRFRQWIGPCTAERPLRLVAAAGAFSCLSRWSKFGPSRKRRVETGHHDVRFELLSRSSNRTSTFGRQKRKKTCPV